MYTEPLSRRSPLLAIVPLLVGLGLMAFITFRFSGGPQETAFYQFGAAVAIVAYLVTLLDIVLGIAILIACISLSPELSLGGLNHLRLEDFIVPALVVAWIVRMPRRSPRLVPTGLRGPLLLYLAAMAIATLLGIAAGTTQRETAVLILFKNVEYFLIFLIVANNIRTESQFRALVVFTLLTALAGFVSSATVGPGFVDTGRFHGPPGEFANIFGGFLVLLIALTLGLYLHSRTTAGRFACGAVILMLGITLLYTYSRTSYAALALGIGLFGVWKDRRLLIILVLMVTLFVLFAPAHVLDRAATIPMVVTDESPSSWVSRTDAWYSYLVWTTRHDPLFGKGLGSVPLGDVDNEYVRIYADTGVAGLAAFLWLLARILRRSNALYKDLRPGTFHKGFAAGYLIALGAMVVHGVGATSFTAIRTMETFMMLTGFMAALAAHREEWGLGRDAAGAPEALPAYAGDYRM